MGYLLQNIDGNYLIIVIYIDILLKIVPTRYGDV